MKTCIVFLLTTLIQLNLTLNTTDNLNKSDNLASACGSVYIETEFVLTSENYPYHYAPNKECLYLLKGASCPTYYKFDFIDFSLEPSLGCTKDRLEIETQDALCGDKTGVKTYFAPNGSLQIKFKTDDNGSGRGYKIFVKRSSCEKNDSDEERTIETTTEKQYEWTPTIKPNVSKDTTDVPKNVPNVPKNIPRNRCCSVSTYNSKTFLLSSPNFPYSINQPTDCSFSIEKANENICRVRIHFLFFYLGPASYNSCPYGFLEIDGKYICGCNSELKLTTTFDNSNLKNIRFRSEGLYSNSYSGFVLEVVQDECPKRYSPEEKVILEKDSKDFRFYNDQVNRVAWPNDTSESLIEKLQLINERTEVLENPSFERQTVKHVYVFEEPIAHLPKEIEETSYVDTNAINIILTNLYKYQECLAWNTIQFEQLNFRFGKNLQTCKKVVADGSSQSSNDCVDLGYLQGYFRSPGYPCYYPGNLNLCYRFRMQPGHCAIRLHFQDFQIENSINCIKDYVALGSQSRYCGNYLQNRFLNIDMRYKPYEEIRFSTDAHYCGRGFSGVYQQIACQDMTRPVIPVDPSGSITTPPSPVSFCDRIIREERFLIEGNGYDKLCVFKIRKFTPNVCQIQLYFENFDLNCGTESVLIDNQMYCGHLTGKTVTINLDEQQDIVYKKNSAINGVRFRISGRQVTENCEVPAQRLIKSNTLENKENGLNSAEENVRTYIIKIPYSKIKDICGLLTQNTTTKTQDFCNNLKNYANAIICREVNEKEIIYLSSKGMDKELDSEKQEMVKKFELQQIDCDNIIN